MNMASNFAKWRFRLKLMIALVQTALGKCSDHATGQAAVTRAFFSFAFFSFVDLFAEQDDETNDSVWCPVMDLTLTLKQELFWSYTKSVR